ncbi:zinc finger, C2H2 type [Oesophagostomum dentatum]|uniref:Zinc finger, C2H2 type n=1 Tax=Oesophagostomum dentatum TaxID=61180 RepID=A0A0B1T6B5_OESDE|nr:zinc finger, C2H2 type [Oesophagostomum dentatum]
MMGVSRLLNTAEFPVIRKIKGFSKLKKTQCSFSIDNLLRPESEEKQTSNTPDSDLTTYTLDALEVSDGRTKNSKKFSSSRCVCDQCGKSYATTSNLSRHKQTHRPLDSEHAKQCPHCDRVYVSMPALR